VLAVLDVASRFADGRLSVDRILGATDEELSEMLVEIKGVGIVSLLRLDPYLQT
jgi:3-methyladenine DNA glycosylase/8-oxoguanine DNA glycosylase